MPCLKTAQQEKALAVMLRDALWDNRCTKANERLRKLCLPFMVLCNFEDYSVKQRGVSKDFAFMEM